MTVEYTWEKEFLRELQQGESARRAGKEGMARVCARRAAAAVAAEYLRQKGTYRPDQSAYALLHSLQSQPGIGLDLQKKAGYFLMAVNQEHELPVQVDLLAEARRLAQELLGYGG